MPKPRLSQRPGFIRMAAIGTPEFSAMVRAAFPDAEENARIVRELARLATQPQRTPSPEALHEKVAQNALEVR